MVVMAVGGDEVAQLGPGLVGGFTTFSAVMVSMVTLAASNEILLALVYFALTIVFGFGAAASTLLMLIMAVWVAVWYRTFKRDLEVA